MSYPWTARRSNQSILKEISPEYSWKGLMLKLKLQCFDHLMRRTDSLEKTLMLGKIDGRRRRGQQRKRWLDGITGLMDMSLSKLRELMMGQGSLTCCSPWGHKESDTSKQINWTEQQWESQFNFTLWTDFLHMYWNSRDRREYCCILVCLRYWLALDVLWKLKLGN